MTAVKAPQRHSADACRKATADSDGQADGPRPPGESNRLTLTVVDTTTAVPGGTDLFSELRLLSFDDGQVTFFGRRTNGEAGICVESSAELQPLVDASTPVPDGVGTFVGLTPFTAAAGDGNVAPLLRDLLDQAQGDPVGGEQ